ncbi:hypothetical protein [Aliikangiella marina]|nr:hypothetical protein [Aliikangiella marina]
MNRLQAKDITHSLKLTVQILILFFFYPIDYAFADYKTDYQQAVANIERKQWQRAVDALNKIKEFNQQELATMPVSGGRTIPYLPKYYKGLALFHLGDCAQAERNWVSSLAQRVIKEFKSKHADLLKKRDVCRSRLVDGKYIDKLAPAKKTATVALTEFKRQFDAINAFYNSALLKQLSQSNPYIRTQLNQYRQQFRQASSSVESFSMMPFSAQNLDVIKGKTSQINQQARNAKRYLGQIKRYTAKVSELRSQLNSTDGHLARLDRLQRDPALSKIWQQNANYGQQFIQYREKRKKLNQASTNVFNVTNKTTLVNATQQAEQSIVAVSTLNRDILRLAKGLDSQLSQINSRLKNEKNAIYKGVDAFFAGNYKNAATLLTAAKIEDSRGQYYQNLFIAAAYFYDPIISEQAAKEKARPYILKAKRLNLKENFNRNAFSPKFIEFYDTAN